MALPGRPRGEFRPTRFVLALTAALLGWPAGLPAQTDSAMTPAPADSAAESRGAPVVLGRDTVLWVRGRLGPMTETQRALEISARLDQLAKRLRSGEDSLKVVEAEGQVLIMSGDLALMAVMQADADELGLTRQEAAVRYLETIHASVIRNSLKVRVEQITAGVFRTVITLGLAFLVGWLLLRLFRRLYGLVDRLQASGRLPTVRIQQLELLSAERIAGSIRLVVRLIQLAAWVILGYVTLALVLSYFPFTQRFSSQVLDYFLEPLRLVGQSVLDYLPNLLFLAVIILVARYVLQFIHFLFRAVGSGAITFPGFEPDWAEPTYKLVRVMVLAFSLVVLFPYLPGAKSDAFKGVSLFIGLLFSLGSSGAVSNMVAGSLLTYTRAFSIGDRVRIGETIGDVVARTLLVTRLRTVTNVEVTIPNATVLSSQVLNYSIMAKKGGVVLQTTVTIGYDVPWRKVHELLLAAARSTEGVLAEPEPFVLQVSLNDYYPTYVLNAYTGNASGMLKTVSRLNERIQDVFFEAGVEITSPAFSAVRDGNRITIPEANVPEGYVAPAFRLERVDVHRKPE
jgi:small-conductance mechanosensitive channel